MDDTRSGLTLAHTFRIGRDGDNYLFCSRQSEMKCCSSSIVGGRPQAAAMRLDNRTTDGQSHAAALRLGRIKRRKDLFCLLLLLWQTHARVTDRELELTVLQ